jgi:hypothetical protein
VDDHDLTEGSWSDILNGVVLVLGDIYIYKVTIISNILSTYINSLQED